MTTRSDRRAPRPLVSVLMPVRDAADTLDEALDSVRAQRGPAFEVIVVDDGSRDGSVARLAAHARRDPRLRVLRTEARGIVSALNHGLAVARAPLVARMDADDRMLPGRLAAQVRYLDRHPRVALLATRVEAFPRRALGTGMREYLRWQDGCRTQAELRDAIYIEAPFVHPSVMFRRDVVRNAGGYRDGPFPEDYELWLRLAAAGVRMAKLPGRWHAWRQRSDSLSRTDPRYARAAFDAIRARYLARDRRLAGKRPLAFWGAGRRTRARAGALTALGPCPSVWIDVDPRKIGNRIGGVPVVAPTWLRDASTPRPFVLGYVASHGARQQIAASLASMGYRRGCDYLMVG